jgi:hypothetical protein
MTSLGIQTDKDTITFKYKVKDHEDILTTIISINEYDIEENEINALISTVVTAFQPRCLIIPDNFIFIHLDDPTSSVVKKLNDLYKATYGVNEDLKPTIVSIKITYTDNTLNEYEGLDNIINHLS